MLGRVLDFDLTMGAQGYLALAAGEDGSGDWTGLAEAAGFTVSFRPVEVAEQFVKLGVRD
jgi:hypothetical protein